MSNGGDAPVLETTMIARVDANINSTITAVDVAPEENKSFALAGNEDDDDKAD